jgi:hypothetical protein
MHDQVAVREGHRLAYRQEQPYARHGIELALHDTNA